MALVAACLTSLLGIGVTSASATTTVISSGATTISAGGEGTCAVLEDGTAKCWGFNGWGQLGDGTTSDSSTPVAVSGLSSATAISAGGSHTCAVLEDGTAACWGFGWLGDGTANDSSTPVAVSGLSSATAISAGDSHTCAVLEDGTAACWGSASFGQLGHFGSYPASATPVAVSSLDKATGIGAGSNHTCAVREDGAARCWGYNAHGQLGDGTYFDGDYFFHDSSAVTVSNLENATGISAGLDFTCALLNDGTARCWGRNSNGQFGNGTTNNRSLVPVTVSGLDNATGISAGSWHTCAVLEDGTARCWGANFDGQLGGGGTKDSATPVPVSGLSNVVAIGAGSRHTCALLEGGAVECWGAGYSSLKAPVASPASPPTPPRVRITSHPPKETSHRRSRFTFTGVPGGTYQCSVDARRWRRCKSGDVFGPLPPGDHRFRVRETLNELTGPADSYSWTIALPRKCVLRVARARVFVYARKRRVRLVVRYKTYRPAWVAVAYRLFGSRGRFILGRARARFKTAGIFRLSKSLPWADMRKVRAARLFRLKFSIPKAPGACARYYTKRLTIPKRFRGQRVWFQSDSHFGVGWRG